MSAARRRPPQRGSDRANDHTQRARAAEHYAPRRESEPPPRKSGGRASRRRERGGTTEPAPGAPPARVAISVATEIASAEATRHQDRKPARLMITRPKPPRHRAPRRHLKRRDNGADAERERVVAAVAAAERAQERAEKRAERAMIAPRARVRRRPASSQPTPSSRRRDREAPSPPRAVPSPQTHRGDGADAERERVVAAVAAAERAQERAEKRAERAMIAPRARVRRRPASSQPTPSSRRRDPSPLATARRAVTSNTQRRRR